MTRYLIVRSRVTSSGLSTEPVSLPGFGDSLILCGPSLEHVLENAKQLGLYGVAGIELDADDRPVRQAVAS